MLQNASHPPSTAPISETGTPTFTADVLTESQKRPVLVYFTASWCGPCKQLSPVMDEMSQAAGDKLRIVKLDIDKHPAIPGQLGIQSVPAVIAFIKGQPVDGFMGALPKAQIVNFIERLIGPIGPADISSLLDEAEETLRTGDVVSALEIYASLLKEHPQDARALAGLASAQAAGGNVEAARATLDTVADSDKNMPAVAAVRARLNLLDQSAQLDDSSKLENRLAQNPGDHQTRLELALALAAANKREEALHHLLYIVRADRTWNDDAARKQLVQFFEAWGPADPLTLSGRRQLSSVLFA
jgi:putative thioredoxin